MKSKTFKYIFSLMLLSVIFILGCGSGGSQSVLKQESPEAAVMRISNNWRASSSSPAVVVDSNNKFIRQATTQETDSNTTSNSNSKVIYLKDIAGGEPYELKVTDVEKIDDYTANVTCKFYYKNGSLVIVFKLIFEDDKWWLDDLEIREEELGENEAYYYIYHFDPDGNELFDVEQLIGTIGDSISATGHEKDDNDKFVYDADASANTINGKVESDGTKLTIYYKRRTAEYTVIYNFYDENGNLVTSMTKEFTGSGNVGDNVDTSKITYTIPDGYEQTEKPESLVINRNKDSNKFVFKYKLNKQEEEEKIYTITGVITDSEGKAANATIKFFKVENGKAEACKDKDNINQEIEFTTGSNGEYDTSSLNYDFTKGDYLLVVYKDGYESQTIKVTLPQSSTESNFRANITLQ